MATTDTIPEIHPAQLKAMIDTDQPLYLIDVRSRADFERSKVEGRASLRTINTPVSEMQNATGLQGAEAVAEYARTRWAGQIPQDGQVVVVCGKGVTSAMVAGALERLGYGAVSLAGGFEAWGNFYQFQPVVTGANLSIHQVARPARGCLSYVVASQGEAVIVDPLRHYEQYIDFAAQNGLKIVAVLDTHGHADHISGAPAIAKALSVPYYFHPYDAIHPIDVMPGDVEFEFLKDGATLAFGATQIQAIHIPGHTLGNLAYLVGDRHLLSGDSIFVESIARPDLGGKGAEWSPIHYRSLSRLMTLSDETLVLPGHFSSPREANAAGFYGGTLGELKGKNEGLKVLLQGKEAFVQYLLGSLPTFPPQYIEIKRVNAGLLKPDEAKASELELGRNICALSQAYRQ